MTPLKSLGTGIALIAVAALLSSCGDASGPGNGAATITANSSISLSAAPGADVSEPPSVVVRDQSGQPLAGVRVTFSVGSGGGTVTGGNATTDASGIATVGSWTLGPALGTNTLLAKTGNLPPVTFSANATDPCSTAIPHLLGSTTNGKLSLQDCRLSDGTFADFYAVDLPAAGTYVFSQTASTFDTYVALLAANGLLIGINDDVGTDTTKSSLKVIVPAARFIIAATSFSSNATGNYTITSATSTAHITGCEDVFVVRGISTSQSLQSSDCALNGIFGDQYVIFLLQGQPVSVSMSSTEVDSYPEIHAAGNNTILASNDDVDATTGNAQVTFTPDRSDFYVIAARSPTAGMTGAYTLTIP